MTTRREMRKVCNEKHHSLALKLTATVEETFSFGSASYIFSSATVTEPTLEQTTSLVDGPLTSHHGNKIHS